MANDFESRLYALLEEYEYGGQAYVDAFKAKGDEARIFGDLSDDGDDYGFAKALVSLMAEFGVTGAPDLRERHLGVFGPKPTYRMRDMSLGTLKEAIQKGEWPPDAWVVRPVSASDWSEWIYGLYMLVVGACLFGVWAPGKLLLWLVHDPAIRAVVGKAVTISGVIFLAMAILRVGVILTVSAGKSVAWALRRLMASSLGASAK